MTAKYWSHKPF